MKYRTLAAFDRDYKSLPPEHQKLFRDMLASHLLPAIAAGALAGRASWPPRLRFHKIVGTSIYSITWSFSGPDGRATFHLESVDGEPVLVWRRIGTHDIYEQP